VIVWVDWPGPWPGCPPTIRNSDFLKIRRPPGRDPASCLRLAALGNSLDFFRSPGSIRPIAHPTPIPAVRFFRDDTRHLIRFLNSQPELIVYLADNAGEIYFDLPLYRLLSSKARRVVLAVKGGPALNDLTRIDLERSGLRERFREMTDTGTDGVGLNWDGVSAGFLNLLDRADLVLAKGMANFETLFPHPLKVAAFFLFKVKCKPMRDYLQAPPDSFMALWRDGRTDPGGG